MTLTYVTGNQRKVAEAQAILTDGFGIDFTPQALEIDEIQHSNPKEVARVVALDDDEGEKTIAEVDEITAKRQSAYEHLRQFASWYTKSSKSER